MKISLAGSTVAASGPALTQYDVVDLGPFDGNRNQAVSLNNSGHLVGVSLNEDTGRLEAFVQTGQRRVMLGTLGGSFSIARGINDMGEIVGGSLTQADESHHGFLFRNGRLISLNRLLPSELGWEVVQAHAINNRGEILGIGSCGGEDRIVLLRPRR